MASASSHTLSWEANMAMRKRRTLRKGMASGFNGGCHYVINQTALVARGELNVVFRPVWLSASGVSRCEPWGNQWRQFSRKANCGIPLHPLCLMPNYGSTSTLQEWPWAASLLPRTSPLKSFVKDTRGTQGPGWVRGVNKDSAMHLVRPHKSTAYASALLSVQLKCHTKLMLQTLSLYLPSNIRDQACKDPDQRSGQCIG